MRASAFLSAAAGAAALALSMLAGSGCASSPVDQLPAGPVRIGMITSLTGALASLGSNQRLGAQLAVDEINGGGGVNGHPLRLAVADDGTRADQAVAGFHDLIGQGSLGIIGPVSAELELAIAPLTGSGSIPLISTAAADQVVHSGGIADGPVLANVFQAAPSAGRAGERLLQYMRDQGLVSMAIVHDTQGALAVSGAAAMRSAASRYGITFVADEAFEASQTQFQPMMSRIRAAGAQGIMVWSTGTPPPLITHAWAAAGLRIPLIFSPASATTPFVKAVGQDGEGVIVATSLAAIAPSLPDAFSSKPQIMAMAVEFQARHGYYPPEVSFNAYAAVRLLAQAVGKAGSARAARIVEALNGLTLNTAGGNFRYTRTDHYGIGIEWTAVAVIKGGLLVPTEFALRTLPATR